ncbi:MAG: CHAT domain-containing protein, partial [Planctomycetota bacterium]|nr:CHAT domain-containing protein [Planctomycetota bacterium]
RRGAAMLASLSGEPLQRHLRVVQNIARLEGNQELVRALARSINVAGGAAEDQSLPLTPLSTFVLGSVGDLAAVAGTTLGVLSRYPLPEHEANLTAHLAAASAMELGEYALAEKVLRLRPIRAEQDLWLRASLTGRLGICRIQLGDYEGALHALESAISTASGLAGTGVFRTRLQLNAARASLGLGIIQEARTRALEVLGASDAPAVLKVRARLFLASVLYEQARDNPRLVSDVWGAFRQAERRLDEIKDKLKPEVVTELRTALAINRANTHRLELIQLGSGATPTQRKKLRDAAIDLQDRALREADKAGMFRMAAVAASNLGELYLERGDLSPARQFVEWALGRAEELHLFETEWRCHWYLARIAASEGRQEAADNAYQKALALVESYRARILDLERKSGFLNDKAGLYRGLVERELERGRKAAALTVVERAKARALVESLGWRYFRLADPADGELYQRFISALSHAERSRQRSKVALFGSRFKSLRYDALRKELAELKGQLTERASKSPVLAALVDGNPSDAARIQSDLPTDRTLVEYYALDDRFVAFVVNGGVDCVELTAPTARLGRIIHSYVRGGAGDRKVARQLYDWLFAPLVEKVHGRKLIIVPFGPLHQLPFETLVGPQGTLTESYELSYLPAASMLKYLQWERPCAPESLRLLAVVDPSTDYNADGKPDLPPLPFARKEVESFEWLFPEREVFVGEEAIEKLCVQRTPENSVIHFACHGEFYPSRPWDSPLFLSPGTRNSADDDGRLRAAEIYGLDLRRSCLVTLSGCETGANEVRPGDDPVSISTAFLHSGAGAMLVSLWKVEDEATATLMATFYKKWIGDGKSKAQSLRETKLEMAAGRFSHPRQWGAFVLIGEP